jgi:diguanylate cyclase (GGDEF)-like protein/putative nucleotidyltransferase with HDIG domain
MKHFFQTWISWWFATMVPVRVPLNTLAARENLRKRRLQSIILFLALIITLMMAAIYGFNMLVSLMLFCCAEVCFQLAALWFNQRGYMELASLLFFGSEILLILATTDTVSVSDPPSMLWTFFPIALLLAGAGIFLPTWIIFLMALGENLLLFWYLLVVRHDQIVHMTSPQELRSLLTFLCVSIYVSAGIGAFYAITSKKAVIQADSAAKLEQDNLLLTNAYIALEAAHTQLATAHSTIQKQALTDGLTGLPNHRAVVERLEKELDRASRYNRPFSVLFFDADRFKHVNDTYGHNAGDAVLHQIGERAASVLRRGDTLGRFGGEEFVLLLPETDSDDARTIAERIRATIANAPITLAEIENDLNVTVSIGVATYPTDGYEEQELLQQADQAMYMAKHLGRNQVRTAPEAVRMSVDMELMAFLQQEEQREAQDRDGVTPERIRENYTVKIICSLMTLVERRDHGMSQHAYAVSDLATSIARTMGLGQFLVSRIGMAALLHDIGKIAIPDILLQKSGRLAAHERALLKEHAELGAQILEACPFLHDLIPAVRHHHERWDGNGYPDQLAQEDIPLAARIIAVTEAYDTMVRERPYQTCRTSEEAMQELWRCAGTQFDPTVVQVFSSLLSEQSEQQHSQVAPALAP